MFYLITIVAGYKNFAIVEEHVAENKTISMLKKKNATIVMGYCDIILKNDAIYPLFSGAREKCCNIPLLDTNLKKSPKKKKKTPKLDVL